MRTTCCRRTRSRSRSRRCATRALRTLASAGWAYFRNRPSTARFVPTPLWESLPPVEWMVRKWENNNHMQTATWLVSRELTEAAGPWDARLLVDDDGEYFSRVIMRSDHITFVPDARVYYRISSTARVSYIGASNRKMEAQMFGNGDADWISALARGQPESPSGVHHLPRNLADSLLSEPARPRGARASSWRPRSAGKSGCRSCPGNTIGFGEYSDGPRPNALKSSTTSSRQRWSAPGTACSPEFSNGISTPPASERSQHRQAT